MDVLKRNNVHISGKGEQPMMFAHGFGCDQHMWQFIVPAFEEDYKIVLFDYVGAGKSDESAYDRSRYGSLDGYAADVLEICEALALEHVIFVGHSVSSMIGVIAALKAPGLFSHLVMVGPSPCYINDGNYVGGFSRNDIQELLKSLDSNYLGWSRSMASIIMGNPDRPELTERLANSFCRTNPEIAKQFARVTFLADNRPDLPKLKTKTLIVQCADDAIAPAVVGQYVHDHVPDSEMVTLGVTGHCPHLSAPEETIAAIKRFLKTNQT